MKRIFTLVILIVFVQSVNAQFSTNKYVENELIIWLDPDADPHEFAKNFSQDIQPKRELSKRLNIWLFELKNPGNQRSARMNDLRLYDKVKYVQNNHMVSSRAIIPDDEHYSQQWAPSVIHLPDVWDEYTTGGTSADGDDIVIAVIDGGFDLTHEDLNFWKNPNEIPGNGIDDDNNGYIDDYDGWNAYSSNGNIPNDDHGTHVAGIAGAIGNNGTGISGVNWNVGILPVAGRSETEATVVEAYSYILEMRALYNETNGQSGAFIAVTNASFGVDRADPNDFPIWCALYDELGSEGILNCAATANANWNIDMVGDVPTACSSEFLISVTNTTSSDNKYTEAGYGATHIDLGAPGTNIYSTLPGNNYGNLTGTSMACPQVAGVIALMYASMCQNMIQDYKNNPENFALTVRQYLLDGADNISSLNGFVAHGRLNALEAIENIFGINSAISGPSIVCSSGATFTIDNLPDVDSIIWEPGPYLTVYSGQNTNTPVIKATGSGNSWVSARLVTECGSVTLPQKNVWVGTPNHLYMTQEVIDTYAPLCAGKTNAITIKNQSVLMDNSITNFTWDMGNWSNYFFTHGTDPSQRNAYFSLPQNISGTYNVLHVTAYNGCGSSYPVSMGYYLQSCNGYYLAFTPNPTTGETTLTIETESAKETFDETVPWNLEVYNASQLLKEKLTGLRGESTKIQTAGWKEGVYLVRVMYKGELINGKLVVKR